MNIVALIPARAGSKRIPGKNTRLLAGHPLLAYTIAAAHESALFEDVVVSSEDQQILRIAEQYGAHPWRRAAAFATDDSPDIDWVREILDQNGGGRWWRSPDAFAILRPTSPFRTAATIQRAYGQFETLGTAHSLRAMHPAREHPGKMWQPRGPYMEPLIGRAWPFGEGLTSLNAPHSAPWHSLPTQTLPLVYVQNASLEIAWRYVLPAFGTISGTRVAAFLTEGYEGVDLNTEADWREAERLLASGEAQLPPVALAGVSAVAPAQ